MAQEETRKGPWTEHEDVQLVYYVNLFGDRRWDFIAKVSGLKRTGKSCRLRWVNYLHPGLKHDKMTPHEERLVLELHTKWGNRWSRIARKLPGRTDNEIKNYWRTYMRKQAQEKKKTSSPSSSLSNCSSSSSSTTSPTVDSMLIMDTSERNFYDTGGLDKLLLPAKGKKAQLQEDIEKEYYSMDDIWNDIVMSDDGSIKPVCGEYSEQVCNFSNNLTLASPIWDYCPDSLWTIDQDESKMFLPTSESFHSLFGQEKVFLTG